MFAPKVLKNYPGYLIYPSGKVFSLKTNKFLKFGDVGRKNDDSFYKVVVLKNYLEQVETVRVHRLVAEAFIPNPNGYPIVNHKDGNKGNNDVSNLEWVTYSQNNQHAYDIGLKKGKRRIEDLEGIFNDYVSLEFSRKELEKKYSWYTSRGFNAYLREYAKKMGREDEFKYAREHLKSSSNSRAKSKKVDQFSKDGSFITTWNSAVEAGNALKICNGNISKCCRGLVKSAGGFIWKFHI